jgi:SAM-dependent methyltransferase
MTRTDNVSWYKHWFNHPLYLDIYRHRDRLEAREAVYLFLSTTGLAAGTSVLDLGCGHGRHAIEFARHGLHVTAADLSPLLLHQALETAADEGVDISLVRADMRHLPFTRQFDGIAQLFTAFGYFRTDEENYYVIGDAAQALKPGGWYFLDFLNAPFVEASLQQRTETTEGELLVVQERTIVSGRVNKRITVHRGDEVEARFAESVRLYTPGQLRAMLETAGFEVEHLFGDYRGLPLNSSSPRCILLGKKKPDS